MVCRDTTHARKPKTVNFKEKNSRLPKAITLQLLVKAAWDLSGIREWEGGQAVPVKDLGWERGARAVHPVGGAVHGMMPTAAAHGADNRSVRCAQMALVWKGLPQPQGIATRRDTGLQAPLHARPSYYTLVGVAK